MDGSRFDRLTRALTIVRPHRRTVFALLAAIVGARMPLPATAGKGGKKGKKRKKAKAKAKASYSQEQCEHVRGRIVEDVDKCADWHPTDFGSGVLCVTALEACLDLLPECRQPSIKQDQAMINAKACYDPAYSEWSRCSTDRDCGFEKICDSGSRRCVNGCNGHVDCPPNKQYCVRGECMSAQCSHRGECPLGFPVCHNNVCRECGDSDDCPAGRPVCHNNDCVRCIPSSDCRPCRGDSDCAAPTPHCVIENCEECYSSGDCPDGPLGRGACDANWKCAFLPG